MFLTGNKIIDADVEEILLENLDWKYFSGKTVLVTGANGMLPAYIVYALLGLNEGTLLSSPVKILALVRNKEKALEKFGVFANHADFELIVKDISDFSSFDGKIDVIIHAASLASPKYYGVDPVGTLKANTLGTMNLLEVARNCGTKKFLFVSSGEVYGVIDGSLSNIEESYAGNVDCTAVRSCYAESKRMGETMCVCYAHQYGIHASMIRLAHTYGPGCNLDDGRVFADFARNVINGENIRINSDGSARRRFMYVTDMIRGLFYVLLKGKSGEAYNIASVNEISIRNLAETLCALYPEKCIRAEFFETKDDNTYIRSKSTGAGLSNEKLRALGWSERVDVPTGFKRMIDSYGLSK